MYLGHFFKVAMVGSHMATTLRAFWGPTFTDVS